ncbi:MAG: pyruvate decarboxylase [Thermodesulfobacteriota bacterium]|nr:MAG: pyruvate decarboxylase [Thermodesulfobacteriota bacterium]
MSETDKVTIGAYIANRLHEIGVCHYFAVPGDYNLILLDELLKNKNLEMIGCCNELNAGYAADGYARANGIAAQVTTFSVGGLSALNAIVGAYAEDLPIIIISGGPNTNSEVENQKLHHTTGRVSYGYQRDIFEYATESAVIIKHLEDAAYQIDEAIRLCVLKNKPVYIEVACNLAGLLISHPHKRKFANNLTSDAEALKQAVKSTVQLLSTAAKPILVAGSKLKPEGAIESFTDLINKSDYAFASMPPAKGLISEAHPNYIGTYWGPVSSPGTAEIVESANIYLFAGARFTDYTTSGFTSLINPEKTIFAGPDFVRLPNVTYNHVMLKDFLEELAKEIQPNNASLVAYNRVKQEFAPEPPVKKDEALTTRRLFAQVQDIVHAHTTVLAETGDSWFNGIKLKLPEGASFEIQMQYGSIGWSVGATLGYSLACKTDHRVIAFIGDGSFQLTAQEVSTMIRYKVNPIIFLLNNGGYTIEVEIHDGPYNNIQNWDYAGIVDVFNAGGGNGWSTRVKTEGELQSAIKKALSHKGGPSLIEVMLDRNDCSKELLEWGSRVASNNARPPKVL